MKLPGIRTFLEQNLGHDVERLDTFDRLSGSAVTESPIFKDNLLSFATCYGLCVQGLRPPKIRTNLIPAEVLQERRSCARSLGRWRPPRPCWPAWRSAAWARLAGLEHGSRRRYSTPRRRRRRQEGRGQVAEHSKQEGSSRTSGTWAITWW